MNSWLKSWAALPGGYMSMSHSMPGMMSDSDMRSVESLQGRNFDKQFLTMMVDYHKGAIAMARDELKAGKNADALALASSIYVTQVAEVAQMQQLLSRR
jgi:uncharacterized protein (DUF305 family)